MSDLPDQPSVDEDHLGHEIEAELKALGETKPESGPELHAAGHLNLTLAKAVDEVTMLKQSIHTALDFAHETASRLADRTPFPHWGVHAKLVEKLTDLKAYIAKNAEHY